MEKMLKMHHDSNKTLKAIPLYCIAHAPDGALPSSGLLGWIESHFHDSTDYYGVSFSGIFNRVTRVRSHSAFGTLRVRKSFAQKGLRWGPQ